MELLQQFKALASKTRNMRTKQKEYFAASAKARRSKTTADFNELKDILEASKDLERSVDTMLDDLINEGYL